MRRALGPWAGLALLVLAGSLPACGGTPEGGEDAPEPTRGTAAADGATENTLVALYMGDERLFGPYWDVEARFLVFQPLVTLDREGQVAPALARSWTHSEDYRRWTFHLRSDVRWHDGEPFTAHDVKFTLDLCSHPDVLYEDHWHGMDSAVVRNDTTVTFFYERPTDALDHWNVYFPKHRLEGLDPERFFTWDFWKEPVGNGPYRYVRHEPQTMTEVESNPDYYAGEPAVGRIILRFGGTSPLVELRSGSVDALTWTNQVDLPKIRADDRFRVYYHLDPDVPWFRAIFWNHEHPVLSDRRVRRALTLALDRRNLAAALNLPEALPVVDGVFSARQHRRGRFPPAWPYDPERARSLLDEAGWRDRDGDGVRDREGRPLLIELLVRSQDIGRSAALLIQDAWKRIGASTEIVALERAVMWDRIRAGRFAAAIRPYYHAPAGHLRTMGGEGIIGYSNPEMTRLLRELVATVNPPEQDSFYREISEIVHRDLPVTLLFPQVPTYVVHRRVKGLESPYRGDPLWHAEDLWIAREKGTAPASTTGPASASEDTLTVLHPADERMFGPSHDDATKFLVFLPLADPAVADTGAWRETISGGRCPGPTGALAESWRHSDDFRTWTVRLREGVRWHDAEPVTSRDVVFTVELWQHPEVGHYAAAGLDSAVAVDDRTVRFHLSRPGDWPLGGWSVIYPEHLLAEKDPAGFYEWEFWTRPVGNGPYRYVRHEPGTMVELAANPAYHRGEPAIDRLRIRLNATDESRAMVELRAGNVDLLQVGLAESELLADELRFRVHHGLAFASSTWLLWNRRHPLLEDVRARRALTHAVDRQALQALLRIPADRRFVTEGPYTACHFRQGRFLEPWLSDPAAARRLLRESGWEDADGDGIRERAGREARFTVIADEGERRKAVFVQDQLRRVGVRAELAILDPSLIHGRIRSGEFDVAIRTRGLAGTTNFLRDTVRLGSVPADIRRLAAAIGSEPDAVRRDSMYRELARLVRADLPVTWLTPEPRAVVARRDLRGLRLPGGGLRPDWRWPFGGVEFLHFADRGEDGPE